MNDYIILLWYSFYAQFEIATALLKSQLYSGRYTYELFQYTWIHGGKTTDIPAWILSITGACWDVLIIYLLQKDKK